MTIARAEAEPTSETLTGRHIVFLALAAAVATATSYTVQPELETIARDLGSSLALTSAAAGLPILGYMLGLALLVPLIDRWPARWLVSMQLGGLTLSLLVMAAAPGILAFGSGLLVSGLCASTGAQMSTLAGKHSPANRRGRALGTVTAGISAGILLGRMVGGGLADAFGWRAMLVVIAFACLAFAVGCFVVLPSTVHRPPAPYLATLGSMPRLLRSDPVLRVAAVAGALWFFAFSLVWTGLSLALALPPLNLSPGVIGLYALAGLSGIAATRVAGQLADRFGSRRIVLWGLVLAMACSIPMIPGLGFAPLMLTSLALFDAGLFAAQVANQSRVLSIDPRQPARYNSAYLVVYFIGGSLGTGAGGLIVSLFGWPCAVIVASLAIVSAVFVAGLGLRDAAPTPSSDRASDARQ